MLQYLPRYKKPLTLPIVPTHYGKLKNHRRIIAWLNDLTDKNIIGRKYSRKLKENKPAIYHLATKSRKILLEHPDTNEKLLKRVYRDKTRSKRLIDHCMLVADIYFYLENQASKTNSKLHFFTKTDLANHYYLPYNRPDAYIAVESEDQTKRYFLEIIDADTPRFMLRSKVAQYVEYYEEGIWQEETGHPDPALLFICPNDSIKEFLHKHISQVLEEEAEEEMDFCLTTRELIEDGADGVNIWERVEE